MVAGSNLFTILQDPRFGRMARPLRKPLWAILVLCCACAFAAPVLGVHRSPLAEQGEAIFQKNCSACHTVGGGRSAGPDLAGVTARRDRAWLTRIITAPGALLDSGDPVARKLLEEFRGLRMPDLGITPKETDAILSYLAEESASPATATQTHPSAGGERPLAGGEPEVGKSLFFGTTRFRNGGAACSACHAISRLLGGGGPLGAGPWRAGAAVGGGGARRGERGAPPARAGRGSFHDRACAYRVAETAAGGPSPAASPGGRTGKG